MTLTAPRALTLAIVLGTLAPAPARAEAPRRVAQPGDDFVVREAMVPMRDGVRLFTLILVPKDAHGLPILLERTPYDASRAVGGRATTRLEVLRGTKWMGGGYIHAVQDIRGRYRSEGDYAMYRVPRGAFNPSQTDETTDAWDTIDWLVKNVKETNGRVGIWGTSYPGWLTLAALRDPHPALVAAVPFNPVVDVWKADDWFHWGAFRAAYAFDYIYDMETRRGEGTSYPYEPRDLYDFMLATGAAGTGLSPLLDARHEMWPRLMESPAYGPYWRDCAADQWFAAPKRMVPTLHVHGLWDQEDIYGAPHVYAALESHDAGNDTNFFVAGPWYHGQHFADGSRLGALAFGEDTAARFRDEVLAPFLRRFLAGDETVPAPSPVTVFETGTNRWRHFDAWPPRDVRTRSLYLEPQGGLAFAPPPEGDAPTEYVSDPANPVPYEPRPNWNADYDNPAALAEWRRWLTEDQRFVDGRPDVATWRSEPLREPLTVRGPVKVSLFAETTGTDADWVVKLIDVFPGDAASSVEMSGYELMVSADIFRGRYRESLESPEPVAANRALEYTIPLPPADHTFLPGHRLMVQVQSTWFPLYDRNPQTFVPSIMTAPASAYRAARQRIHHSAAHPTHLELLVDDDERP
jgi:putative CocE/NonD family hydrolase